MTGRPLHALRPSQMTADELADEHDRVFGRRYDPYTDRLREQIAGLVAKQETDRPPVRAVSSNERTRAAEGSGGGDGASGAPIARPASALSGLRSWQRRWWR